MQGISIIYSPNGQPSVLTIDLRYLDPVARPLVDKILELWQQETDKTKNTGDEPTTP